MPVSNDRKIISLAALTEFKTKYDTFVNSTFVPYSNATQDVDLGSNSLKALALNVGTASYYATLGFDDETSLFAIGHAGIIQINNTAHSGHQGVAVNTTGLFTYNGVEVATKSDISSVYRYRGTVSVDQLNGTAQSGNITSPSAGDTYNISAAGLLDNVGPSHTNDYSVNAGDNVSWVQPSSGQGYWDVLAGTVDLSNYYTKTQIDGMVDDYLPLTGGTMTGAINTNGNNINFSGGNANRVGEISFGSDANNFGRIYYGRTSGSDPDGWLKFESDNGKYHFKGEDSYEGVLDFTNLETSNRSYTFPDESGTLVTGEYATTGTGGDIAALFS